MLEHLKEIAAREWRNERWPLPRVLMDQQPRIYDDINRSIEELRADPAEAVRWGLLSPHLAGMSLVQGILTAGFSWVANNNLVGAAYQPISNNGNILKRYNIGTVAANNAVGGADEIFSFQQGVPAGSSVTVNLQAMTNLLGQAAVNIARFKGYMTRLLSATDDATISPAPNSTSTAIVTNGGNFAVPNALDFGTGNGLALNTVVAAGALNTVSIMTAGSGYPPSATFIVLPQVVGGTGGEVAVTTNTTGVPTGVPVVVSGGAGYTNTSNVPTTPQGAYLLATGDIHEHMDVSALGVAISNTAKNFQVINNDAVHAITFELDVVGATT